MPDKQRGKPTRKRTKSSKQGAKPTKKRRRSKPAKTIHVLTDGTGGLPRHFLAAVLSQFPNRDSEPKYHVFCDSAKIRSVMSKEVKKSSIVIHAFAEQEKKHLVTELADGKGVSLLDLTGPTVAFLAEQTGWSMVNDLSRVHANDTEYFDRIDAWEFTMQHDDSRRLESIDEANIVLIGLSRVSKTPTSAYLGWLGHRVANVSFVPELGLPDEVHKCRRKVVAFTMQPRRLSEIRSRRMRVNGFHSQKMDGLPELHYAGIRDTIREVAAAEQLYRKMKIPIVDVTESTVEETAARVLELLKLG